jgi:CRP/FNR family transcriptional regulator
MDAQAKKKARIAGGSRHPRRFAGPGRERFMAPWRAMSDPIPLDLAHLRKSCAHCSLQQLCLPAGIDADELRRLDEIVKLRRPTQRNERLFRIADPLVSLYIARDGAFKTVSVSEQGEEQIVGFHLPGELIGLDALGHGVHRCEAIALTNANVCEVPLTQLTSVAAQLPRLQQQLLRVIGQGMGRDQDHLNMLVKRQASERIALFLHGLGERYQLIGQSALQFKLPMSREDIANYLGLALETVSRGFTRLQEDGVISVHGRLIGISDRPHLNRLAHVEEPAAMPLRLIGGGARSG